MVALWAIWHAHRKALHEVNFQSPLSTLSFINWFIYDLEIQKMPAAPKQGGAMAAPRWIASPAGVSKINVNAALSKNNRLATVAAIARDPEILEAVACREGMALASDLYLARVKLASDCANVIRRINGGDTLGPYGQLIQETTAASGDFVSFSNYPFMDNVKCIESNLSVSTSISLMVY
jgi:hypothetical protein